jgi:hypothetical protein
MDYVYDQLVSEYGAISYEAFINFLVDITEDQTSAEQLRESFRGIAADKVCCPRTLPRGRLLRLTLHRSRLSQSSTSDLRNSHKARLTISAKLCRVRRMKLESPSLTMIFG